jgi:hypothetical protein
MFRKTIAAVLAVCLAASPASAARLSFEAVPQDGVSAVRWLGSTKMTQQKAVGRVSVVPRGLEGGKLAFDVEVHNLSDRTAFFGQDSVEVRTGEQALKPSSTKTVERTAKRNSTLAKVGVAVVMIALVGVAAYAAGARGPAPRRAYIPPLPAASAAAPPPVRPSGQAIPDSTTVPGRHVYSGRIFVERPKNGLTGEELKLLVSFNGEDFPFAYRVSQAG